MVLGDRIAYAKAHGYGVYARYINDAIAASADSGNFHEEFSKLVIMRQAMYAFPNAKWMWWLDQDAVIMRHEFSIERDLLGSDVLESNIQRGVPVWPPDGVVLTYRRVPSDQFRFFATRNDRGISTASFILSNDAYGHFLLSYWLDPLHQMYEQFGSQPGMNRRVDNSVTHMLQWHPTILSRFAYVKHERLLCTVEDGNVVHDQSYRPDCIVKLLRSPNELVQPDPSLIASNLKASIQERESSGVK
jgi:mannan polymerase II complex MNN11 subunit